MAQNFEPFLAREAVIGVSDQPIADERLGQDAMAGDEEERLLSQTRD
jgi:hypothetical protein